MSYFATAVALAISSLVGGGVVFLVMKARGRGVVEVPTRVDRIFQGQQLVLEGMAKGVAREETMTNLIQFVEEITPGTIGSVQLKKGNQLFNGGKNRLNPDYNAAVNGVLIGDKTGSCVTAAFRGERVVVEDITTHPYWAPYQELAAIAGVKACWSQPIMSERGEVLGTFAMYHAVPSTPLEEDLELLERAAHLAAIAIISEGRAEEIVHKTEQLKDSNRDLEQFAYVASHDLQEPLRTISSYLTLIKKRYEPSFDEEGIEFLDYAVTGSQRLSRMIADLLEFSRVHSRGKALQTIGLESAASDALVSLKGVIAEAKADVTVAPDLPQVKGDKAQLALLFQNLIGNALKYKDENRSVQVAIGAERKGDEWIISVRDNGIGIEPQYYEKIFDIFQRLHRREVFEGTGIGLSICKRIVERHGGHIWVESVPGEGSVFIFSLPSD